MALPKPPRPSTRRTNIPEQFNRLVGNRTGRRLAQPKTVSRPRRQQAAARNRQVGRKNRGISVSLGTSKLPKSVERSREAWFGDIGDVNAGLSYGRQLQSNLEDIYDEMTSRFVQIQQERTAVQNEYIAQNTGVNSSDPIEKWNAEHPDNPLQLAAPLDEQLGGTPIGRTLDVLNRPFYAVNESLRNALEEEYKRQDKGDRSDYAALPGDFASGFWEGLSGKKKTGSGEIYEEFKEGSDWSGLRTLEKNYPWVEEQLSRVAGLTGELTTDPTNIAGLGRTRVMADSGERATAESFRRSMEQVADDAANDVYDNIYNRYSGQQYQLRRDTAIQRARTNMLDAISAGELDIGGGARRGKYQVMNDKFWGGTAAHAVTQGQRNLIFEQFNNRLDSFWGAIHKGKPLSPTAVEAFRKNSRDFDEWIDLVDDHLVSKNRLAPGSSLDELLQEIRPSDQKKLSELADQVRQQVDPDLQKVSDDVKATTRNASYPTLGIRVGGKVIPVKATGRAYNAIAQKLNLAEHIPAGRSYEALFPGSLSLLAQRGRSVGAEAFEEFKNEMVEIGRQYTPKEAEIIHFSIEEGTDISANPHLQAGKDKVIQAYDDMFNEESAFGARPEVTGKKKPAGGHKLNNYVYVYNQRGSLADRTEFKTERKKVISKSEGASRGRYTTKNAISENLHPVTNAFDAVMLRKLKSQRDITRARFTNDLVDNYGMWSNELGEYAQHNREVSPIPYNQLSKDKRLEIDQKGGAYYLPNEHADAINRMNELTRWNSAQMGAFMREWNKVINWIKKTLTIYAPGFHINNMIGDAFMGLFDGVKASDYAKLGKKFTQRMMGGNPKVTFVPGHIEYSLDELWTEYKKAASGGYYNIDIGGNVKTSARNLPMKVVRGVDDKVIWLSEMREDFGRFAHFIHAMEEEAVEAFRKNKGNVELAKKKAIDSSLWRVNYYRFDYNALTLWERKLKTIGVPFYTYMRKVIPVLLASMFENPKYINLTSRFFQEHDGSAAQNFSNWNVPDYLRKGGAAFLTDEEEPFYASLNALPLGRLNFLQGGAAGTMNPTNTDYLFGMANEAIKNLNPPLQALFEMGMGKEAFTGNTIYPNERTDFLLNKIPLMKDILEEGNAVPGLQNIIPDIGTGRDAENPQFFSWDTLSNRLFGAGVNVRRLTRGQQEQQHQSWLDELIQFPISTLNRSQDIYQIDDVNRAEPGGRVVYNVRSKLQLDESGQPAIVRQFGTAQEAIDWVRSQLPEGYRKPEQHLELDQNGRARYVPN